MFSSSTRASGRDGARAGRRASAPPRGLPRPRCVCSGDLRPSWSPQEPFTFLFVGKLIPLHGLETILAAAREAPELRIRVVGSGQLEPLLEERPPNVEWIRWVEYDQLPGELHRAGAALGI